MQKIVLRLKWNAEGIKERFGEEAYNIAQKLNRKFREVGDDILGNSPQYGVYALDVDGKMQIAYTNLVRECPVFYPNEADVKTFSFYMYLDEEGYWGQMCPIGVTEVLKGVSV